MADRARAPRDLRGNAQTKRQATRCEDAMAQSGARRRLDQHRPAGDDRKRGALRNPGGRLCHAVMKSLGPDMPHKWPSRSSPSAVDRSTLDTSIAAATKALLDCQRSDGHWVFELEADSTIPAEYVLLKHYLDEPLDPALEQKFAVYLRRQQGAHGGWPLFHDGDFDMSASVK